MIDSSTLGFFFLWFTFTFCSTYASGMICGSHVCISEDLRLSLWSYVINCFSLQDPLHRSPHTICNILTLLIQFLLILTLFSFYLFLLYNFPKFFLKCPLAALLYLTDKEISLQSLNSGFTLSWWRDFSVACCVDMHKRFLLLFRHYRHKIS